VDLIKFFTDQLNREAAASRKVLERVPTGKNSWKPHDKSMEMGRLAVLVAQMPAWIDMMIHTEELILDSPEAKKFQMKAPESSGELLKLADESAAKGLKALRETNEQHLNGTWSLKFGGKALSSGPRHQQIADTFTHLAHHRGQLTVYLRLNEAKVPAIYGPTADEHF
jgi:uncharacterized damage-inducible protein DinB